MKIADMNLKEVMNALEFMRDVPKNDPYYSGWNFDKDEYKEKLQELYSQLWELNKEGNNETN